MNSPRLAYLCFDVVALSKGASIHIAAFTTALATVGQLQRVTVSPTSETQTHREQGIDYIALPAIGPTLIDRVLDFRQSLRQWLVGQWFDAIQIRSIYEGLPIALHKERFCRFLIYEVNGLPSIELKYRYPQVATDRELMNKLRAQEQRCLEAADLIVTPSGVTRDYLTQRGLSPNQIRVIPNGVDCQIFSYQSPTSLSTSESTSESTSGLDPQPFHLLYFGTLSAWQGVSVAIEALALYCRQYPARLTIFGAARSAQLAALRKLALRLGVADAVHFLQPVTQSELVRWMHQADAIVAPLTANDRNLVQGCCPLKVLEGMASGTPVITSNLPVVRELGEPNVHFLAVRPGSAKAIQEAMLHLRQTPGLGQQLSVSARQHIEQHYTWTRSGQQLRDAYAELGLISNSSGKRR